LDLEILLTILIVAYGVKALCYGIYFLKDFKQVAIELNLKQLKYSIPFFIPIAVGTIRVKIDAYYGTHFFSVTDLSKYQIFLSFLVLAQMVSSFALTPYIKNFYRAKDTVIIDLQRRFFKFGWVYAVFMGLMMFIALSMIYQLTFTFYQYLLGVLFMIPLFLHILLISEYYKKNLQTKIAFFAFVIVLVQIISGYFLISYWSIDGALILKVFGQWSIVIILWLWIRKRRTYG
jgi:O-antigen/teichoic acid export membrane protein